MTLFEKKKNQDSTSNSSYTRFISPPLASTMQRLLPIRERYSPTGKRLFLLYTPLSGGGERHLKVGSLKGTGGGIAAPYYTGAGEIKGKGRGAVKSLKTDHQGGPINETQNRLGRTLSILKSNITDLKYRFTEFIQTNLNRRAPLAVDFPSAPTGGQNEKGQPGFFSTPSEKIQKVPRRFRGKKMYLAPTPVSITYEEIGFFPRSFSRVFDRFLKQVFCDVENLVIQEYRFYRYLFLTTLQCLFLLLFIPFLVNTVAKQCLVQPLTEYYWNTHQSEIFLNSYQQKRAFGELKDFEEKLYFEVLLNQVPAQSPIYSGDIQVDGTKRFFSAKKSWDSTCVQSSLSLPLQDRFCLISPTKKRVEERLQQKTVELAIRYNTQSIEAITTFFADLLGLLTLFSLFFILEKQISISKAFLLEVFFGLEDSNKSLLILLVTDLLVGYHSSNLWELFFQFLFHHYGLPENQIGIFFLVATIPVLLDIFFKYLIFRHLNRTSPTTVATYHAMIE